MNKTIIAEEWRQNFRVSHTSFFIFSSGFAFLWYSVDGQKRYEDTNMDGNLFMRFWLNETDRGFRKRISVETVLFYRGI